MDSFDPYLYPQGDFNEEISGDGELMAPETRSTDIAFGTPAEIALVQRFMNDVREKLDTIERIIAKNNALNAEDVERLLLHSSKPRTAEGKIIEGVFDGEYMLGADGKQYTVPSNYASKSKLVEGDILKLTIIADGSFIFKQIGPIPRERIIGMLAHDEVTGDYLVIADKRKWNVLLASVTYFRAEPGDQMVVLVPKDAPSRWAAVENVIRNVGNISSESNE